MAEAAGPDSRGPVRQNAGPASETEGRAETDLADRFRKAAAGHANAAEIVYRFLMDRGVQRSDSTWISLHNLIGLAAESGLKSYLISHGIPVAELRKRGTGHDLQTLHQMAADIGLREEQGLIRQNELCDTLARIVEKVGPDHGAYIYRYIEGDEVTLLDAGQAIETTIAALRALTDLVSVRLGQVARQN